MGIYKASVRNLPVQDSNGNSSDAPFADKLVFWFSNTGAGLGDGSVSKVLPHSVETGVLILSTHGSAGQAETGDPQSKLVSQTGALWLQVRDSASKHKM